MKTNIIKVFGLGLIASMTITSCSDDFLEEKKNYDNVNTGITTQKRDACAVYTTFTAGVCLR